MSFGQMMIRYCAPTICNIKPGNIFFIKDKFFSTNSFEQWKQSLACRGIMSFAIKLSETSTAIFVCNASWIKTILSDEAVRNYLFEKGYYSAEILDFVAVFTKRLRNEPKFPHEIGIVLGYPVVDVIEFENHEGNDCKYCGYWKTYSDVDNAKICQCRYKKCCRLCKKLYEEGLSLNQIVYEYKKSVKTA